MTIVAVGLAPVLLWRRTRPLACVVVGFGTAMALGLATLAGGPRNVGLTTMITSSAPACASPTTCAAMSAIEPSTAGASLSYGRSFGAPPSDTKAHALLRTSAGGRPARSAAEEMRPLRAANPSTEFP